MCGIVCCVGESKNPAASHLLTTSLLAATQRRGHHATGHLCVTREGGIDSFKAPMPSSLYVKTRPWQRVPQLRPKVVIGHARWATKGDIRNNLNNHPFVHRNMGIVHNGTLHEFVKDPERFKEFDLQGECDSELLLRMLQRSDDLLRSVAWIFKALGAGGDFVCAGVRSHRKDARTDFFLFRDSGRPARFVDLREELGQYFFCSTTEIWREAIEAVGMTRRLGGVKVQAVGAFQLWRVCAETMELRVSQMPRPRRIPKTVKEEPPPPNKFRSTTQDVLGMAVRTPPPAWNEDGQRVFWYHQEPLGHPTGGKVVAG